MPDSPSNDNPYKSPAVESTAESRESNDHRLAAPLGTVYWGAMIATFVVCALLIFVPWYQLSDGRSRPFLSFAFRSTPFALGLLCAIATVFAVVYGVSYSYRITRGGFAQRHRNLSEHPDRFYFYSMSIGFVLTISTLTAFVCCCVPVSIPFVQYSAGGGMSRGSNLPTILAVLVALAVGGFMIRLLLPREDLQSK